MTYRTDPALIIALLMIPWLSLAQDHASSDQTNQANNPLTPKITVNVQDQWAPELYESDEDTNALLLRGLIPHRLGGPAQLFRFTLPVVTAPTPSGDTTGLGDLNLIDLFPFKAGGIEIAVGGRRLATHPNRLRVKLNAVVATGARFIRLIDGLKQARAFRCCFQRFRYHQSNWLPGVTD